MKNRKLFFLPLLLIVLMLLTGSGSVSNCNGCGGGGDDTNTPSPVDPTPDPVPDPTPDPDPVPNPVDKTIYFHVAPDGNDGNTGSDKAPLATLGGVRDKIRELKTTSGLPAGGVVAYLRNGVYGIPETVGMKEEDSGTENVSIAYKAYPGEKPVLSGGVHIRGGDLRPVTDEAILARLPEGTKSAVLCVNLFENGFTYDDLDYGKDFWAEGRLQELANGRYADALTRRMQVFIDDTALHLARYPNKKPGTFPDNPYDAYLLIPQVTGKKTFITDVDRVKHWKSFEDVIVFGMLSAQYEHDKIVVDSIDPNTMTVTLRSTPNYDLDDPSMQGARYAFENVLEELDSPGEYWIDKHTGMLYLCPTKNMSGATVKISRLDRDFMLELENVSNVTFSGLTFELTKGSILSIRGGRNCVVENCTFKNFGVTGVRLGDTAIATRDMGLEYNIDGRFQIYLYDFPASKNGFGHRVARCDFMNTGFYACAIYSGNAANREGGNMLFADNRIRHSGLLGSTYRSGLLLNGAGITVRNNDFFYCLGQAISGNFVDTEIVYNEFCDSPCDMAEDTGTIYCNYICINDGVKIRYNWFHDVTNDDVRYTGWGYALRAAVAYDNINPDQDLSYNVISNVPIGVYAPRIVVPGTTVNNIFIDCNDPICYSEHDFREQYEGKTPLDFLNGGDGGDSRVFYTLGIYKNDLWREKYPRLHEYYTWMATEKKDLFQPMDQLYNNLFVNIGVERIRQDKIPDWPVDPKYGKIENNLWLNTDPGFAGYAGKKFQLPKKTAEQYGVEWIDMSKIGSGRGRLQ